jgi:hypothetical protein
MTVLSNLLWKTVGLTVLSAGWLEPPPVLPKGEDTKVRVTVIAILATDRSNVIDPKLERFAKEVQKTEPQLTGFTLAQTTRKTLAVGNTLDFPLVDKQVAEISVEKGMDTQNRVSLKVKPPQVGEIVYTSACGKFFPIVTRYQTKDKERLIIAIMVRPSRH